jgi:hypothetical protein
MWMEGFLRLMRMEPEKELTLLFNGGLGNWGSAGKVAGRVMEVGGQTPSKARSAPPTEPK